MVCQGFSMRALLAPSVGIASLTALALPLVLSAGAATPPAAHRDGRAVADAPAGALANRAPGASPAAPGIPGATRTLPLAPTGPAGRALGGARPEGVNAGRVKPFSLLGVTWDDPAARPPGTVQVRTRSVATGHWSGWQDVEANSEDEPGPGDPDRLHHATRGGTAPLWVGDSDGVQVRVEAAHPAGTRALPTPLPRGLRLDMIDPNGGTATAANRAGAAPRSRADDYGDGDGDGYGPPDGPDADDSFAESLPGGFDETGQGFLDPGDAGDAGGPDGVGGADGDGGPDAAPGGGAPNGDQGGAHNQGGQDYSQGAEAGAAPAEAAAIPGLSRAETSRETGQRFIGARPRIVTRAGWGADEHLRRGGYLYTGPIKVAFIHHSATGNNYTCAQAPAVIRSIYRYHVKSDGWRDIGYNFLVDKCGTIYEGRAGGVDKPVMGAHTLGFNADSVGIAVLGTYEKSQPPAAAVRAVARLAAWKLGLYGIDPASTTTLVSEGSNKYAKGVSATFKAISGHRDGFTTECPGDELYNRLAGVRSSSADLQGR
jgi:hypothetical protein